MHQPLDVTCALRGCANVHPRARPLCEHHWRLVPDAHKQAMQHHYQRGQELSAELPWVPAPSPEYLQARAAAIAAVEARIVPGSQGLLWPEEDAPWTL
jgi:hypothetical protein